jgi:hypothetical protein
LWFDLRISGDRSANGGAATGTQPRVRIDFHGSVPRSVFLEEGMPRYLIHVGPHKTGTTYMQLRFDAARERLRHSGVAYPTEWSAGPRLPSHLKLCLDIRAANVSSLSSTFEQIARSGVEDVLISAEDLNGLEQKELGYLREALGGDQAMVIFYCRRWSELLPSLWQERVKHGFDETFPEFLAGHISDPLGSPVLNFAYALDKYARAFGRENVRIVSYSNVCDDELDLAEHFFDTFLPKHRAVLDGLPPMANARPNPSLPMLDIEVIRALNSFHAMNGGKRHPELREWYTVHARQFDLSEVFSAIGSNTQTLRLSDASSAMARLHEEVLTGYPGLMVAPLRDGRLFDPGVREISFAQPRYLMNRAARAALEGVYAAFLAASRAAHDGSRAP